jgi:hypothetical protein
MNAITPPSPETDAEWLRRTALDELLETAGSYLISARAANQRGSTTLLEGHMVELRLVLLEAFRLTREICPPPPTIDGGAQ